MYNFRVPSIARKHEVVSGHIHVCRKLQNVLHPPPKRSIDSSKQQSISMQLFTTKRHTVFKPDVNNTCTLINDLIEHVTVMDSVDLVKLRNEEKPTILIRDKLHIAVSTEHHQFEPAIVTHRMCETYSGPFKICVAGCERIHSDSQHPRIYFAYPRYAALQRLH